MSALQSLILFSYSLTTMDGRVSATIILVRLFDMQLRCITIKLSNTVLYSCTSSNHHTVADLNTPTLDTLAKGGLKLTSHYGNFEVSTCRTLIRVLHVTYTAVVCKCCAPELFSAYRTINMNVSCNAYSVQVLRAD